MLDSRIDFSDASERAAQSDGSSYWTILSTEQLDPMGSSHGVSVANRLGKVPGDGMRLPAFGEHQGKSIQVLRPTKPGSVIFLGAICCSTRLRHPLCSASSLKKRFGKTQAEVALE